MFTNWCFSGNNQEGQKSLAHVSRKATVETALYWFDFIIENILQLLACPSQRTGLFVIGSYVLIVL
jgi:hypothetical protein